MSNALPRIGVSLLIALGTVAVLPTACSPEEHTCEGTTSPCVLLDEASCATVSSGSCGWGPSCEADCLTTDPVTCQSDAKQKYCYLAYTKQCVPRDGNACTTLTEAGCTQAPGCRWAAACEGSLQCAALTSEEDCNQRLQCSWQQKLR